MNSDEEYLWDLLNALDLNKNQDTPPENMTLKCSNVECDSEEFISEDTNLTCSKCGTVQSKDIDLGAEWRYYGCDDNKTNNPTRCGMPTNEFLPKSSLGSIIGIENSGKNFINYHELENIICGILCHIKKEVYTTSLIN